MYLDVHRIPGFLGIGRLFIENAMRLMGFEVIMAGPIYSRVSCLLDTMSRSAEGCGSAEGCVLREGGIVYCGRILCPPKA